MARLVPALCPKCGAGVQLDDARDRAYCAYCGTSSFIRREKGDPPAPTRVPHEPTVQYGAARNIPIVLALVGGTLTLGTAAYTYVLANARTVTSKPTLLTPPPAPPERSDRPSVKLATPLVESGPAIQDSDQVIGAMSEGILRCYEQALRERKSLRGDFSLHLTVTPSSTEIRVRSSQLPGELVDCIQDSVRSFSFASQANTTLLRVDGTLTPPDPPPCGCAPGDPLCSCL